MNQKLSVWTRIIALICGLLLIAAVYLPIWRIELSAPQYPEGLILKIYSNKLGGDVEVVNGLNHYIGMKSLHAKDFVEFTILPYLIYTLAFFGLLSVLINRRWFYFLWVFFFIIFGIVSMMDFYRWLYNYGHNLDPTAPIRVPGMTYQPPLLGYKQLLNFGAYSIPDSGGFIIAGVVLIIIILAFFELRSAGYLKSKPATIARISILFVVLFTACQGGPQPIMAGKDACAFCKMTVTDKRFANELITSKGKVYKFDDVHCLVSFMQSDQLTDKKENRLYFIDFASGNFIELKTAGFLQGGNLHSPMGSDIAVLGNSDTLQLYSQQLGAKIITWESINK